MLRWIRQQAGLYSLGDHTYYIIRSAHTWEIRYGSDNGQFIAKSDTLREAKDRVTRRMSTMMQPTATQATASQES